MTILLSESSVPATGLPLTEADYFSVGPTAARVELWDGTLHACPRESPRHQLIQGALASALRAGRENLHILPSVVEPVNLWLGWIKSILFGGLIALLACHFGLRVKPNTESLGQSVTQSVVTAITLVIVVDAIFAVLFSTVGV